MKGFEFHETKTFIGRLKKLFSTKILQLGISYFVCLFGCLLWKTEVQGRILH